MHKSLSTLRQSVSTLEAAMMELVALRLQVAKAEHQPLAIPLAVKRAALFDEAHVEIERAKSLGNGHGKLAK